MSSTNSTSNYGLSQFIGTDKPAWLADYNQDMSKIDTQMKLNADSATSAAGSASTANTAVGTLANLTTTAKTDLVSAINEVDSNADTAQNTANEANISASSALTEIGKFNLTNRSNLTPSADRGNITSDKTYVRFASDTSVSVFKLYGRIQVRLATGTAAPITITMASPLRPSETYTIEAGCIMTSGSSTVNTQYVRPCSIQIATDGTVTITTETLQSDIATVNLIIPPCLYFNTNFGD